jgi:peptidoglycan hydrolase-like protein with peptidoglycan-binding domain
VCVLATVVVALTSGLAASADEPGQPQGTDVTTTSTTAAATTTTDAATTTTDALSPTEEESTTTTVAPAPTRYEQDQVDFAYAGGWATSSNQWAFGGSFAYAESRGASVNITFDGTYLAWFAKKGAWYGQAQVVLDGGAPVLVDLYSAYSLHKQQVYNTGTLDAGPHTVSIYCTGQKRAASTGTLVDVDAIDVLGTLTPAPPAPLLPVRYQQNDYRLAYVGSWYATSISSASGGSFCYTGATGATALVSFTGTWVDLLATTGRWHGKALVSLDGGAEEYADFYSVTTLYKRSVYKKSDLSPGAHTLTIRCAGEKDDSSSGYAISLDALDIGGYLTQAQTTNTADGTPVAGLPDAAWLGLRLAKGSSGAAVTWLEQRLTDLSYRPGPIDGRFDERTRQAVVAFEKWQSLSRDGVVVGGVWRKLMSASRPVPRYWSSGTWLEVNKQKQVLLYCVNGNVERTLPVSTGSARVGIVTPLGLYHVQRKNTWERVRYKPLYLTSRLLAIHGYTSVPTYPASHGCIRTTWADQDELNPLIPVGTVVRVY